MGCMSDQTPTDAPRCAIPGCPSPELVGREADPYGHFTFPNGDVAHFPCYFKWMRRVLEFLL